MTYDNNQRGPQDVHSILDAGNLGRSDYVASYSDDEQVPKVLIKDERRRHAAVTAGNDDREWMLLGYEFA